MNIFEYASKNKLRFNGPKGQLSAEDLWSLPLTKAGNHASLDSLAVAVFNEIQDKDVVSFVNATPARSKVREDNNIRLEILKHIIESKKADADARAAKRDATAKQRQIESLIEEKQAEGLKSMSIEDLQALLAKTKA